MAFKSMKDYNQSRYGGVFRLVNDGDKAKVVPMYRSDEDVLIASTHYIKSAEYNGYVHCCGRGCPACAKGIRVQEKLFIPVWNDDAQELQFWDRSPRFEPQLKADIFDKYPNPSNYFFTITRQGVANDINTRYIIAAVAKNTSNYDDILAKCETTLPEGYSKIIREYDADELARIISTSASSSAVSPDDLPEYQITPRGIAPRSQDDLPEDATGPISTYLKSSDVGDDDDDDGPIF